MSELISYCGFCKEKVSPKDFKAMFNGKVVTLACGHENTFDKLFTPIRDEYKDLKNTPAAKRATWYLLTPDGDVNVGTEGDNEMLILHTELGAWDAFHSGQLQEKPLFLYSFKVVHRFMDFDPKIKQSALVDFDSKEFEGIKFISKDLDPGSLGVVVKKSHLKLLSKKEVTKKDAPKGSLYA